MKHIQLFQVGEELGIFVVLFWPCSTTGICWDVFAVSSADLVRK